MNLSFKKYKISFFIDKKDIEVECTKDNIINITGMIGSGKSTTANKYRKNDQYIVISLDCLYRNQDKNHNNQETIKINQILREKYPNQEKEEFFRNYYLEILEYITNYSNESVFWVLEGQHIYRFLNLEDIKGTLIIKRTSVFHCWIRSIKRHAKNRVDMWYWIKRRTKQIKYYRVLNKFLFSINHSNYKNKLID